jgi:hypothetical protein
LVHSYGPQNNDKIKELANEVAIFPRNHQLGKVVEMKGTDGSFVHVGFSRTGTERLKNWSGKCEGPGEGDRRVKEPEWEMRRIEAARGANDCLKRKVFLKDQKHQPNIVEITNLCIMHGVHTSLN